MSTIKNKSLTINIIIALLLILIFAVALIFRVVLPYHDVFVGNWMKFTGNDAFYYMRLLDNYIYNFPNFITFDPFARFPEGLNLGSVNLFVAIMAFVIKFLSFGSISQNFIDISGIYFPAVSGALVIIPTFFIGKALFNRWAGLIAAGLMAVMPGEVLGRTIIGYTDRDSIAIVLSALSILLIIIAMKSAIQNHFTPAAVKIFDSGFLKTMIYCILAGLCLGFYLCVWVGGFFIVMSLLSFIIIQLLINHFTNKPSFNLIAVNTIIVIISLIIFIFYSRSPFYLSLLFIALFVPPLLTAFSYFSHKISLRSLYFILILIAAPIIAIILTYLINPGFINYAVEFVLHYLPFSSSESTVMESQSILFPGGQFSLDIIWGNFTTTIILGLITLGILIYKQFKERNELHLFLIAWCIIMLVITLLTRRVAVLFSLNLALLSAYLLWAILEKAGFKEEQDYQQEMISQPVQQSRKGKKGKQKTAKKQSPRSTGRFTFMVLAVIIVLAIGFLPNATSARDTSSHAPFAPDNGWYEALDWLKKNSPDPFGDPQFYYKTYSTPFQYPDSAYTIISWWDYGYWIMRNAHRIPVCDPGGGDRINTAKFLTAQTHESANKIIDELKSNYIIIDFETVLGKFYAVAIHSGKKSEDFYELCYQKTGNNLSPVMVYYPEYYTAEAVRLYNFDGKEVTPQTINVISYVERQDNRNQQYKEITGNKPFDNYKDAENFIQNQKTGKYKIVGFNPFSSPVPLEAARNYQLVYKSNSTNTITGNQVSTVKIFEYKR